MRIFSSITAGLLLLFAVLTVGFGAVVLVDADSDGSVTCSNTASASHCSAVPGWRRDLAGEPRDRRGAFVD